jgi:hypothetical protein
MPTETEARHLDLRRVQDEGSVVALAIAVKERLAQRRETGCTDLLNTDRRTLWQLLREMTEAGDAIDVACVCLAINQTMAEARV